MQEIDVRGIFKEKNWHEQKHLEFHFYCHQWYKYIIVSLYFLI